MGIRKNETNLASLHELVTATGEGTFEAELAKVSNQVGPAYRAEPRHQATP